MKMRRWVKGKEMERAMNTGSWYKELDSERKGIINGDESGQMDKKKRGGD